MQPKNNTSTEAAMRNIKSAFAIYDGDRGTICPYLGAHRTGVAKRNDEADIA